MKDKLNADLKTAMLARDSFLTDLIKGLKAAITEQEITQSKRESGLSDPDIENLLVKEAKKRLESAQFYEQAGNQPMADKERRENEVIMTYLPKQLTEAEIEALVEAAIKQTGAEGPKDIGKVISAVKAKAGSSADGGVIAKVAKSQLQ